MQESRAHPLAAFKEETPWAYSVRVRPGSLASCSVPYCSQRAAPLNTAPATSSAPGESAPTPKAGPKSISMGVQGTYAYLVQYGRSTAINPGRR